MTQYLQSLFKYVSRNAHMRVFLLLFLALLMPPPFMEAYAGIEDRTFDTEAVQVSREVATLLVKKGICEHERKKCRGHIISINYIKEGFQFNVFNIEGEALLEEITRVLFEKFLQTQRMQRMAVFFYKGEINSSGLFKKEDDLIIKKFEFRR